jgi:hypothetical protein
MGTSLRYFIADDDGSLTLVPRAKRHRQFFDGEGLPAERAAREAARSGRGG